MKNHRAGSSALFLARCAANDPVGGESGVDHDNLVIDVPRADGLLALLGLTLALALLIWSPWDGSLGSIGTSTFYICIMIYFGTKLWREKPWRPLLIVTSAGLQHPRFSSQLIPWSAIAFIDATKLDVPAPMWRLDVRIRTDAPSGLTARSTTRSPLFTHVPGIPNISIMAPQLRGISHLDLTALLRARHMRQIVAV